MTRPLLVAVLSVMYLGIVSVLWSHEQHLEQPSFLHRRQDITSAPQTNSPSRVIGLDQNSASEYNVTHVNEIGAHPSAIGRAQFGVTTASDIGSDASTGTAVRRASISPVSSQTDDTWYDRMNKGWSARFQGYKTKRDIRKASERAWAHQALVVTFDSRRPEPPNASTIPERPLTYWWGSAYVWAAYARAHNHQFVFYTRSACKGCDGRPLFSAWCKVAALLQAYKDYPRVNLFLYTDSDSTISEAHFNTTILEMAQDLAFLPEDGRPILLNQDGPGSWCQENAMLLKPGVKPFEHCLNSGALLLRRHPNTQAFLEAWWAYADLPRENTENPFKYDVRIEWPHDQGPMAAVKEHFRDSVVVVPHPQRQFMNWPYRPSKSDGWQGLPIMPYCFSHGELAHK